MHWNGRGRVEQAVVAYRDSVDRLMRPQNIRLTQNLVRLSYIHVRYLRDLDQAQREAIFAQIIANTSRGQVEQDSGQLAEAQRWYELGLEIAATIDGHDDIKSNLYGSYANLCRIQHRNDEAIFYSEKSAAIHQQQGNLHALVLDAIDLCSIYVATYQFDKATQHAEKSLHLAQTLNDPILIASSALSASDVYLNAGFLDRAEQLAQLSVQQEDSYTLPYGLVTLGQIHQKQGKWDESLQRLGESLDLAQAGQDRFLEALAHQTLALVYRDTQRLPEARTATQAALALFTDMQLQHECDEINQLLSQLV